MCKSKKTIFSDILQMILFNINPETFHKMNMEIIKRLTCQE